VDKLNMGPERPVTLFDIALPGFTLRDHGWRVLRYDHGVVLARLVHPDGLVEFGTWEPDFEGACLSGGDYVFSRCVGPFVDPAVPDEVAGDFDKRARRHRQKFMAK
jgi:hypothetical protein